jgi:hypothetical protein
MAPPPKNLRFRPWSLPPEARPHTTDPETGIYPIAEWGSRCAKGFVRDQRFQRGTEQVIPGTNRATSRKWRRALGAPGAEAAR